jgi:phosphomannomutase
VNLFDYVFSENGLVAHKAGSLIGTQNLVTAVGDAVLQPFVNFCLRYIADLDIPVKRGTFIEFRSGMINVSPVGRNCSQQERDVFEAYDKVHGVRAAMVAALRQNFPTAGFTYSIGGQVRVSAAPTCSSRERGPRELTKHLPACVFLFS